MLLEAVNKVGAGPSVNIGSVGLLCSFARSEQFRCLSEFGPSHIIGGIGYTKPIKQIFVVEQDPEVRPIRQAVDLAIDPDVFQIATVPRQVNAVPGNQVIEGPNLLAQNEAAVHRRILCVEDIDIFASSKHDEHLVRVLRGGHVVDLYFDIRVAPFKLLDQCLVILVQLVVPACKLERNLRLDHRGSHKRDQQNRSKQTKPILPHANPPLTIFVTSRLPLYYVSVNGQYYDLLYFVTIL